MVTAVKDAFRTSLTKVTWMDDETKQKAIEKVEKVLYIQR